MKFYKRLPINRKDPMSNRFAVEADGRIVTDTTRGLQLPNGTVASRSGTPVNGEIRYNQELGNGELEAYIDGTWQIIKTNRQAQLTQQIFENGDYADTLFGPLAYDVDVAKSENVFVYVENVPQIAGVNFELRYSSVGTPITTSTVLTQQAEASTTTLYVSSVADFNPGHALSGTNIDGNTIVDTSSTDKTITITPGTFGVVTSGTTITSSFDPGTYVKFYENATPVPNKPVITLLGLDGYGPPFEV